MQVFRLKISQFRNLAELDLEFSPHFNFIYGPNGSGKSSLLEAIHFLSLGRSFRSALASRAIHYEAKQFNLFSVVLGQGAITLGLEKTRHGKTRIKIDNNIDSISELAKVLPIQLVNPNSYYLLSGGPKARRQFVDWGVFHVEPHFFLLWKQFQQTLKQRNAALQRQISADQIKVWNYKLIEFSVEITCMRKKYLQQLTPLITELIGELISLEGLTIDFYQGWDQQSTLENVLSRSFFRDSSLGYTHYGPQRADLLIKLHGNPVHEVLSRGEQKLLAYGLQLAQGLLLKKIADKSCIYLFDDLFAELDSVRQAYLVTLLNRLESQVFITVIEASLIKLLNSNVNGKTFQVEKGKVLEK
ncbi:MAG: DNA replication/repair protein RecF [Pseudomonadota bacterium]